MSMATGDENGGKKLDYNAQNTRMVKIHNTNRTAAADIISGRIGLDRYAFRAGDVT
jgi:hypothetical protein